MGLIGLASYFDGQHTWTFDAAKNAYVDETGRTEDAAASAAAAAPQTYTYRAAGNPFLYSDPTGSGIDGSTQHFNPNNYATPAAAARFAAAVGGTVITDPTSARFDQAQTMLAIRLPDGTVVNAGAIGMILENDAAFPSEAIKSGEIAKLFGAAYRPGIAAALESGAPVRLVAGEPAPGYNTTPLSRSFVPATTQPAIPATAAETVPNSSAAAVAAITSRLAQLPPWAIPAAVAVAILLMRK
jgi:hypothetical protein